MLYRRWRAAALFLMQPSTGEAPPSCFSDWEVDDDCIPRWVPPVGRYRTGTRPRLPVDWLFGPAGLGCGLVSVSFIFFCFVLFCFTLFSILNFKSVLQNLVFGTFYQIP
jgi:hypothetical protein